MTNLLLRLLDVDYAKALDWTSIKVNGLCVLLAVSAGGFLIALSLIATTSTIIYNAIRIYKELKNKK